MGTGANNSEIVLTRLANLRDLGGIEVDGGVIKSGVLFRSDDVSVMTNSEAVKLIEQGLCATIDLRSPEEGERTGRGPLGDRDVAYHALPLTPTLGVPRVLSANTTPEAVGRWYATVFVEMAGSLVRGLEIIAHAPASTLFHCAAGKDRTGVFAAGVLSVLGASQDAIISDYTKTDAFMPAILERLRPVMAGIQGAHLDVAGARFGGALLSAPPSTMAAMLRILDEEHAGALVVLCAAGLRPDTVAALQAKLVEPVAA